MTSWIIAANLPQQRNKVQIKQNLSWLTITLSQMLWFSSLKDKRKTIKCRIECRGRNFTSCETWLNSVAKKFPPQWGEAAVGRDAVSSSSVSPMSEPDVLLQELQVTCTCICVSLYIRAGASDLRCFNNSDTDTLQVIPASHDQAVSWSADCSRWRRLKRRQAETLAEKKKRPTLQDVACHLLLRGNKIRKHLNLFFVVGFYRKGVLQLGKDQCFLLHTHGDGALLPAVDGNSPPGLSSDQIH